MEKDGVKYNIVNDELCIYQTIEVVRVNRVFMNDVVCEFIGKRKKVKPEMSSDLTYNLKFVVNDANTKKELKTVQIRGKNYVIGEPNRQYTVSIIVPNNDTDFAVASFGMNDSKTIGCFKVVKDQVFNCGRVTLKTPILVENEGESCCSVKITYRGCSNVRQITTQGYSEVAQDKLAVNLPTGDYKFFNLPGVVPVIEKSNNHERGIIFASFISNIKYECEFIFDTEEHIQLKLNEAGSDAVSIESETKRLKRD